jgi:hypothetical protein
MDDWGPALGGDSVKQQKKTKSSEKTTLGLMYYFKNSIPYTMDSTTNSLALMKTFKDLRTNGVSYNDIYKMIDRLFEELAIRPLAKDVLPWQVFIKQREELLKWVTVNSPDGDVEEWKNAEGAY